ncbi:hypothetical protein ACS0TY_026601 [Phlomoides rotata]
MNWARELGYAHPTKSKIRVIIFTIPPDIRHWSDEIWRSVNSEHLRLNLSSPATKDEGRILFKESFKNTLFAYYMFSDPSSFVELLKNFFFSMSILCVCLVRTNCSGEICVAGFLKSGILCCSVQKQFYVAVLSEFGGFAVSISLNNMRRIKIENPQLLILHKAIMRRNVLLLGFSFAFIWMHRLRCRRNYNRRRFRLLDRIPDQGCLSALDDTYIDVLVPTMDKGRYRNRKGLVSVNVLGVCDTNMRFAYVLTGWEGSAADSRVLLDAIHRPNGLRVPRGNIFIYESNAAPKPQEYFNMKHTRCQNVIERTFGLLKMC